ncbi:MAG: 3-oxoacyl-ACP reductase FabG [Defluviitaleaceae bacterium]|nr:3-oxoacyl-ACP reductase FabG [Defluviitaleaceae bacterium]
MRLKNKTAIITGGAKGIGQCIAQLFSAQGAQVIACDMAELSYADPNVEFYKLDVSNPEECTAFFEYATGKYPKIDVLVNNAGITRDALTRKMTDDQWTQVIDVNLNAIFYLTRHFGPLMQAAGCGSIINISSVVGEYGNIGQANYAATKSALFGLSKSWAKEFAMKGGNVRVNNIAPGYVMTDILKTVPQDLLDKFASQTMLGRLGQPEEIANAALFLASDESVYITGHTLSVNGGMRL